MPDSEPPYQHHEIDPTIIPQAETPSVGEDGTPHRGHVAGAIQMAKDAPSKEGLATGWSFANWLVVAICWCLVLGFVVFSLLTPYVAQDPQSVAEDQPLGMGDQIQALYFLGMQQLPGIPESQAREVYEQLGSDSTGTLNQRLGDVILAGEFVGAEEAQKKLEVLTEKVEEVGYEPTPKEKRTKAALEQLYRDYAMEQWDAPSLTEDDRQGISENLGWLGTLAIEPKQLQSNQRIQMESDAKNFTMFLLVVLIFALGMFGLGSILAFMAVVLVFMGYLRSSLKSQTGHGHIYMETFVLWMIGFLMISLLIALVVPPSYSLIANSLGFPASLLALVWPWLRGVRFAEVCGDLGITLRRAWLEPFAGLVGYIAGFPLLVLSAFFMIGLMAAFGEQASPDNFQPVYEPSHPINETMEAGGASVFFWVALMTCVMAPLVEETIFRGVLYRHLRDMTAWSRVLLSTFSSAAISGFVFAAIHPQGIFVVPVLGTLGFIFAVVREWRGSLIAPMVMHAIHNGMVTLMLVMVTTLTSS